MKSKIDVFLARYTITSEKHEMLDLKGNLFDDHPETIELDFKADIFLKMRALYMKNVPDIRIKKSPERSVVVTRAYKIGGLVLVMAYPKIASLHDGPNESASEVPYGSYAVKGHGKKIKMWVSPSISPKLIIPAWWCATTPDKTLSNSSVEWVAMSGIQFPCIVNNVALKKGDVVVRYLPMKYVEKQEKQAERKLFFPSSVASPMGSMGAPPSKKTKTIED